jgi:hypothetical protein
VPAPDLGEGNPPSLIRLADDAYALTYGYRPVPYGIRGSENLVIAFSSGRLI